MGILVQPSNFTSGYWKLPVDSLSVADITAVIARYEQQYIYAIFSNEVIPPYPSGLGDMFIAACNAAGIGNAPAAPFAKIYNPLTFQVGRFLWQSKGMVDIMSSMILYEYIKMTESYASQSGVAASNIDAANKAKPYASFRFAESRWNDALISVRAIQRWIHFGNGNSSAGNGGQIDYPQYIQPPKISARFSGIL